MHNGWIIDNSGDYLLFTEQSTGGPLKPLRSLSPLKGLKSLKPLKGLKELTPLRPLTSLSWSDLTDKQHNSLYNDCEELVKILVHRCKKLDGAE